MPESMERALFLNREMSWLAFNERVLDLAHDATLPVHERLRFLAIASSNLDEFFMVRVAGLKQQLQGVAELPADGMLPSEQLAAISERVHRMVKAQDEVWHKELRPLLTAARLQLVARDALTQEQRSAARGYFRSTVFPALTPLAVDSGHPFPHLRNKSLNLALELRPLEKRARKEASHTLLAVVQAPGVLPRLVPLPGGSGGAFLLLEELILLHAAELFPGHEVQQAATFRLTRNWDLDVDEEESQDLLASIQQELRRRDRGAVVRLELDAGASEALEARLTQAVSLGAADVYRVASPIQLQDLTALSEHDPRAENRVEPFVPTTPAAIAAADSMFQLIAQGDVLLHHPYESFDPVVRFLEEAADDPNVLAIKQTLYRTTGDSPVGRALVRASENGKQVAVLVELKARLDEANNIAWARRMEESGVHVVYGLIGLKTHSKVTLVVRRDGGGIRRYVHLGTGNYNPATARAYTDLSLFTARAEMADDVTALFNLLTGYSTQPTWKRLAVAPVTLQPKVLELIEREAAKARRSEPGRIIVKVNALVDPVVIRALYAASQAGVEIDLLVRGICCLRPGLPGVSERIRVHSVVDRFLEHSRAFAFGTGDQAEVYISSADWMPRNFHRRVEVMAPVEDPLLRRRILDEVLGIALQDTSRARRLLADGSYAPVTPAPGASPLRSQKALVDLARRGQPSEAAPLRHLPSVVGSRPASPAPTEGAAAPASATVASASAPPPERATGRSAAGRRSSP